MKVIARTSGGYLIEANADEIAQIQGYTSQYDSNYKRGTAMDIVGQELDITAMVKTAAFVRTLDTNVIKSLADRIESSLKEVRQAGEAVEKLNLFDKLKD
jgi:hypothetical protein